MTLKIRKYIFIFFFALLGATVFSQITAGKITYERKTNLMKKYKNSDWIKEEDKNKMDFFDLYFNDTLSAFKPVESELRERMSWATTKNSVYQNFGSNERFTLKTIWGEVLNVKDTMVVRKWKITSSTRTIAGYNCRKAVWQANDTTRIYAWYAQELQVSTGPESFNGLPGVILGLATEDGGVVYFAKKVEIIKPEIVNLVPGKVKGKVFTGKELRAKLEKDYGKEKWGKAMIHENFDIW
jgi:GLPGLI family protein